LGYPDFGYQKGGSLVCGSGFLLLSKCFGLRRQVLGVCLHIIGIFYADVVDFIGLLLPGLGGMNGPDRLSWIHAGSAFDGVLATAQFWVLFIVVRG